MRYELNFDEDKIIDIEAIGDNGILDLKDCCDLLNEQQAIINNQEQRIRILQQEINDTQAILEMLTEKLKGWNDE